MAPKTQKDLKTRGRKSTFTPEQIEFLLQFLDAYLDGPRTKGEEFWNNIIPRFYKLWPLPEPDVDLSNCTTDKEREEAVEKAKKEQKRVARERIKSWFARAANKANRQKVWAKRLRHSLTSKKSKPRPFTERTMFKFYGGMDAHKDKVEERAEEALEGRKLTRDESIAHWCKIAKELWGKESEDVREDVREAAAIDYQQRFDAWERDYDPENMTEADREDARDNLNGAVKPIIAEVCRIAGFATGLFLGGLPASEGRPQVICFDVHHGNTILLKNYAEFDKPAFQALCRSFATFTDVVATGRLSKAIDGPSSAGQNKALMGLLPFDDLPDAESSSQSARPQTERPPITPAPTNTHATSNPAPAQANSALPSAQPSTAAVQSAGSCAPDLSTANTESRVPDTPAAQHTPASEMPNAFPSPRSRDSPATAQPRRPKPKPVAYDVPANISTMLVRDFTLNNAFRALLQRMPPSARDKRLSTMQRWQLGSLKRANKLAEENAGLGAPSAVRDKATLKEIFKAWEDRPAKSTANVPATTGKRKRRPEEVDEDDYESEGSSDGESAPALPRRSTRRAAKAAAPAEEGLAGASASTAPSSSTTRAPLNRSEGGGASSPATAHAAAAPTFADSSSPASPRENDARHEDDPRRSPAAHQEAVLRAANPAGTQASDGGVYDIDVQNDNLQTQLML